MNLEDRISTLNRIANAFYNQCYKAVIEYGTQAQSEFRYKTFSLTKEVSTLFMPEDVLLDYVLESYERGYLTFMIMASHYKLNNFDAARVELRRLNNEMGAEIYNYGEDPVNILFQAVMWEKLNEMAESRVDWKNFTGQTGLDKTLRDFGSNRTREIDSGGPLHTDWKIFGVGEFPDVQWDLKFRKSDSGYFAVYTEEDFLPDCSSPTGLRISTKSWFKKISKRHEGAYHPLMNAKAWIRLPIGITYGITTFTAGAGILVGGCAADAYAKGNGDLCRVSIEGGAALIAESPKVLRYSLKPDLRHWKNVPSSFVLTTANNTPDEACFADLNSAIEVHQIF
ncbi:MAG TPA: hypothetical protein VIU33_07685 [Nitrospiria bacterium]